MPNISSMSILARMPSFLPLATSKHSFHSSVQCNEVSPRITLRLGDFQCSFPLQLCSLTIYHQDNSRSLKKPDHVFIIFKNEDTIKSAKMHLVQRNTSDAWIKSYNIVSGTKYCLPALMNQIKSIAGEAPISSINSPQSALSCEFIC